MEREWNVALGEGHLKDAGHTCAPMFEASPQATGAACLTKRGWFLTGVGLVPIVWAMLRVTSAAYSTGPNRDFAERRSCGMTKPRVHEVSPIALVGGALRSAGARRWRLAEPEA